jgi:hypothetical protein
VGGLVRGEENKSQNCKPTYRKTTKLKDTEVFREVANSGKFVILFHFFNCLKQGRKKLEFNSRSAGHETSLFYGIRRSVTVFTVGRD